MQTEILAGEGGGAFGDAVPSCDMRYVLNCYLIIKESVVFKLCTLGAICSLQMLYSSCMLLVGGSVWRSWAYHCGELHAGLQWNNIRLVSPVTYPCTTFNILILVLLSTRGLKVSSECTLQDWCKLVLILLLVKVLVEHVDAQLRLPMMLSEER